MRYMFSVGSSSQNERKKKKERNLAQWIFVLILCFYLRFAWPTFVDPISLRPRIVHKRIWWNANRATANEEYAYIYHLHMLISLLWRLADFKCPGGAYDILYARF